MTSFHEVVGSNICIFLYHYQEPGEEGTLEKRKRKRDPEEKDSELEAKKEKTQDEEGKQTGPTVQRTSSPELVSLKSSAR